MFIRLTVLFITFFSLLASTYATETLSKAESGESFEIGGTHYYVYIPQCMNCGSKQTQKNKAKQSAENEANRLCREVGAKAAAISDFDLDVNYENGWLLNVGAPRSYYAVASAKCVF